MTGLPQSEIALPPPEEVRCFEGTDIPELTMERDGEWLAAVMRGQVLGADTVDKLNIEVNVAQCLSATREQIENDKQRISPRGIRLVLGSVEAAGQARRRFYQTLAASADRNMTPNTLQGAAVGDMNPSHIIALTRILHAVVGEHIDEIMLRSKPLYRLSTARLSARIETLRNAGVDPRAVLLASPNTLARGDNDDERLIELARMGERRYREKLAAASEGVGAIVMPTVKTVSAREDAPVKHMLRFERLADITGISGAMLRSALPELDGLSASAFEKVLQGVNDIADTIRHRDLRIRDVASALRAYKIAKGSNHES
jgi:hypothetical protein